jgi:hypothetical protein
MTKIALSIAILAATLIPLLYTAPAHAQATRTWVSGVGDDANPCSRTAPCKTFAGAISKTTVQGEIDCLDPGGFGALTITKSITIDCEPVSNGGVLVSGTDGIVVAVGAGTTVTLRGLDFEGAGAGLNGINITQGGIVHVEDCLIRDFVKNGIDFDPNTSGALLTVDKTTITDNNNGTTGYAGILVRPTGGANASVTITDTKISNGVNGIFADGTGGGGTVHVNVSNSVISKSSNSGVVISGSSSAFDGTVVGTLISYSANTGAAVAGASSSLTLGSNTITNNVTAVAGGTLLSFKNNQVANNTSNGTPFPIPAVPGYTNGGQ